MADRSETSCVGALNCAHKYVDVSGSSVIGGGVSAVSAVAAYFFLDEL
jgi:hypothetical protein